MKKSFEFKHSAYGDDWFEISDADSHEDAAEVFAKMYCEDGDPVDLNNWSDEVWIRVEGEPKTEKRFAISGWYAQHYNAREIATAESVGT